MTTYVDVHPDLLRWALARAGKSPASLEKRFKRLPKWLDGAARPTLNQLRDFADATYVSLGQLFLESPPPDVLPISDFRTIRDIELEHPSPELVDTIHICQRRQDWFRSYLLEAGAWDHVDLVGCCSLRLGPIRAAKRISKAIDYSTEDARKAVDWESALRAFVRTVEAAGILVMRDSQVGDSYVRRLNPREFRGFCLSDELAPLIFINAADSPAAQMFTLAHELAHLSLRRSGVSDQYSRTENSVEKWCNRVAAELLVPKLEAEEEVRGMELMPAASAISRAFRVSSLVAIRRLEELGLFPREDVWSAYRRVESDILERIEDRKSKKSGSSGPPYPKLKVYRSGVPFVQAVISSVDSGKTTYTYGMNLLSVKSVKTFDSLKAHVRGVVS